MFFGQAEKVQLSYGRATGLPFKDSQEENNYVKEILEDVLKPEELESLRKNGVPFGLWSRYRNEYTWDFKSGKTITFKSGPIGVKYLKGDSGGVSLPFDPEFIKTPRPLPRRMSITPQFTSKNTNFVIYFNEFELMDAFEKLGANGELVTIECDAKMPREDSRFRVYNDKESIELTKTVVSDR